MRGYGSRSALLRPLVGQLGASDSPAAEVVDAIGAGPTTPSFYAWEKDLAFAVDVAVVRDMAARIQSDSSLQPIERVALIAIAEQRIASLSPSVFSKPTTWVVGGGLALVAFLLLRKSRAPYPY